MVKDRNRRWLSVSEFRQSFPQLSRTFIYESVRANRLPSIKIGGKILIPDDAFETLLEQNSYMKPGSESDLQANKEDAHGRGTHE